MSKERYECEYEWIIDNNKRKTKESIIVYDEEWNTLDDICELLNRQDKTIADLEAKLAESEKRCDKQYSKIQRDSDYIYELEEELEKKDDAIATWQTMYESVVKTCHNDAKEIERLSKQLADTEAQNKRVLEKLDLIVSANQGLEKENSQKENTINNLIEDNRASQEWYKKQLEEKETEIESYKHTVYMNMINQEMLELKIATQDQDKISFAVEKLTEVKEYFRDGSGTFAFYEIEEYIDKEIKEMG